MVVVRDTVTDECARPRVAERCGFALTGERQPVPFHPSIDEVAMIRRL